jgi:hypothetical protein
LASGFGQALFVHVAEREVAAATRQLDRERSAHAGCRTGDGSDLVLEVFHDRCLLVLMC